MSTEIKNARIVSTRLGAEDHGIFTAYITLDYGGSGQAFGGYAFDGYDRESRTRVPARYGAWFVQTLLDTLRVTLWEQLPGTPVRVEASHDKVHRIGHFMEDRWFDPTQGPAA